MMAAQQLLLLMDAYFFVMRHQYHWISHRPKRIDVRKQTDGEKWKVVLGSSKEVVTVDDHRWAIL
jgi:hypothetical protein